MRSLFICLRCVAGASEAPTTLDLNLANSGYIYCTRVHTTEEMLRLFSPRTPVEIGKCLRHSKSRSLTAENVLKVGGIKMCLQRKYSRFPIFPFAPALSTVSNNPSTPTDGHYII
jgi:hypothetical protein